MRHFAKEGVKVNMNVCIVEDHGYRKLFPLTKTRPVFGLRCGRFTLEERILSVLSPVTDEVSYITRPYIEPVWRLKNNAAGPASFDVPEKGHRLFLNGRVLFDEPSLDLITSKVSGGEAVLWLAEDTWAAMYLPDGFPSPAGETLANGEDNFPPINRKHHLHANVIRYPWDLIEYNPAMIEADFNYLDKSRNRLRYPPLPKFTAIINNKNLMIGANTEVQPLVTFDGQHGPIIVGDNVRIESGTYIKGPVSIGDHCLVTANTTLYENISLGNTCKAGGEIHHSILHGYTNKRHSGFLGNAYLGEWVNIGAGTYNSNLKNNYNTVKVPVDGEVIDTGNQFVGLFMGDHCCTAIGTMFNTATFVGVGCNIFGHGFPPKYLEDFTWNCTEKKEVYNFDKFIECARRMMIRREEELSVEEEQLLRSLYDSRNVVRISSYQSGTGENESEFKESS